MAGTVCNDWLEDFVVHTSYGEAPPEVMWWVGVSTIAGALRRKVWIEEFNFQWTPNFFILLVGFAGELKKSTSTDLGMRILKQIDSIDFGPQETTWPSLVKHMGDRNDEFDIPGRGAFIASCTTFAISEFGTFFKPEDLSLVDGLTDLWDSKLGEFKKETKTAGTDIITNPWLNLIAGTTPEWLDQNFTEKFIGTGFASRLVLVTAYNTKEIAYPSRKMPKGTMWERETELAVRLGEIGTLAGEFRLTEAAYQWGEAWYTNYRAQLRKYKDKERGLHSRAQTHLHKLAMVISAARGRFPVIDVEEMMEADRRLSLLSGNAETIFGSVGQTPQSKLAKDILDVLVKNGSMEKRKMFAKFFFRTVSWNSFEDAIKSARQGGLLKEVGDLTNPILELV